MTTEEETNRVIQDARRVTTEDLRRFEAATAADIPAVMAAFDAIGDSQPVGISPRRLEGPCRCGYPDESPNGPPPVRVPLVDLTEFIHNGEITFESSPARRACRSCTHPIEPGREHVVRRLTSAGAVFTRFHLECVEIR